MSRLQHFSIAYTDVWGFHIILFSLQNGKKNKYPSICPRILLICFNESCRVCSFKSATSCSTEIEQIKSIVLLLFKETKSATMNIFRFFLFSFQIICKSRIKIRFHNKYVHYSSELHGKVNYLIKQVCFSRVGNYLRPSNNYRQVILT